MKPYLEKKKEERKEKGRERGREGKEGRKETIVLKKKRQGFDKLPRSYDSQIAGI